MWKAEQFGLGFIAEINDDPSGPLPEGPSALHRAPKPIRALVDWKQQPKGSDLRPRITLRDAKGEVILVDNPADLPSPDKRKEVREPYVQVDLPQMRTPLRRTVASTRTRSTGGVAGLT